MVQLISSTVISWLIPFHPQCTIGNDSRGRLEEAVLSQKLMNGTVLEIIERWHDSNHEWWRKTVQIPLFDYSSLLSRNSICGSISLAALHGFCRPYQLIIMREGKQTTPWWPTGPQNMGCWPTVDRWIRNGLWPGRQEAITLRGPRT